MGKQIEKRGDNVYELSLGDFIGRGLDIARRTELLRHLDR